MKDQIYNGQVLRRECVFCQYHPSNAAKTSGTQPTDAQQLKAEIAALANELSARCSTRKYTRLGDIIERMRQLSAV